MRRRIFPTRVCEKKAQHRKRPAITTTAGLLFLPDRRPGRAPLRNDIVQYVICVGTTRKASVPRSVSGRITDRTLRHCKRLLDPHRPASYSALFLHSVPDHLESSRKIQPVPARFVFLLIFPLLFPPILSASFHAKMWQIIEK